jgi:hypothetical protein
MPLSAEAQRKRRAKIKKLADPPKFRRKRCDNCGELFQPTRAYPVQKFCQDNCRKEFHKNGGNAFGPLKSKIEGMIRKGTAELEKQINRLHRDLCGFSARLAFLEIENAINSGSANEPDAEAEARAGGETSLV